MLALTQRARDTAARHPGRACACAVGRHHVLTSYWQPGATLGRCPHAHALHAPAHTLSIAACRPIWPCARGAPAQRRPRRLALQATPGAARAAGRPATRPALPGRRSRRTRRPTAPVAAARPTPGLWAPRSPPPAPRRGCGSASGGAARHTAVSLLTRVCAGPVLQFVCAGRYDTRYGFLGSRACTHVSSHTRQWAMPCVASYPGQTLARAAWPQRRSAAISASGGAPAELPAQRPPPRACPPHLG